ncbi:MAG: 4-hydroxy-tetrahydrodipicolinate reductase [Bacteroidales bacterium]|nr:4-hydroxy-tetrahydrodipicolinate reductase [Bacteroidales bacterium]MBR4740646.1 4-hydroxy-tetrahydrodipicolinate reductase [Bacteroidales bacterium]
MIKVIISGYGRMGHMIEQELRKRGIELVQASEDIVATDPKVAGECVCIDFTTPEAFRTNYPFIARHFKAAVVGTTGWNDIRDQVRSAFEQADTPLIYASNFSLGVNALFAAAAKASALLKGAGYVPAIEEIHHIHKLDAPSGTALTLGALVENTLGEKPVISSVREGEVPGIHVLTLKSDCDELTFRHEAFSREGLAKGAVVAALMTEGLQGVHEFSELL